MTDIARLGFSADTSELDKAKSSLDALVPSAKRAENATKGITAAAAGLAGGIKPFNTAVQQAAAGAGTLNRSVLLAGTAMGTVKQAAVGAASAVKTFDTAATGTASTVGRLEMLFYRAQSALSGFSLGLRNVQPAANGAKSALDRLGASANDNINRMQATPGNIAAQFQDIGVTAAAGMNPMIIALQQGTQLSAAMSGGIGNLVRGIGQMLSPVSLLTIGIVGLIAAGIQMVDWAEVGASALNMLADVMETIAPYAVGIAAALALIYAPAIIAGIWSLATAFYGLAAGMLATIGIPALIVLGLAAIVAAANVWRDELTQMLGFDIVAAAKTGVNTIIAFFVGGYNAIAGTWRQLPGAIGDWAIQAANATIDAVERMIAGVITRINAMTSMLPFGAGKNIQMGTNVFGNIANPYAGQGNAVGQTWGRETQAALGVDYVGAGMDAVTGLASDAADWLRNLAGSLGAGEAGKPDKSGSDRAARGRTAKTNDQLFAEVIEGADKHLRALQDASAQIGVYGEALERLKAEQMLFNDAQDKGVVLTAAMSDELKRRAAEMASLAQDNVRSQFMEDASRAHGDDMFDFERQRAEIGLTGEALTAYRYETDLLAQARQKNIDLNPVELAALQRMASEYAAIDEAIQRTVDALAEARETARGFFQDWFDSIREGKNIFASFADAVIGGLERIASKMMDRAIDKFLDMMFAGNSTGLTGGGGLLDSVFSAVFGVKKYAKGDTFTNSIVDRPTLFSFAKGTALGEMGEAGPEAVIPLKRGPDGSLGVQGSGVAGNTLINDVKVDNHFNVSGVVTPQDIMRAIRAGSEQTQREVKRQLMGWLQEIQVDGGTV